VYEGLRTVVFDVTTFTTKFLVLVLWINISASIYAHDRDCCVSRCLWSSQHL